MGVRYTNFDMDSYDAGVDGEAVATTSADNMTVFSIPFGVSLSKDIAASNWTVKPAFDLTLTANTGDTEFDTDTPSLARMALACPLRSSMTSLTAVP